MRFQNSITKYSLVLIFIFLVGACSSCGDARMRSPDTSINEAITVCLALDKELYKVGEPILATYTMTNISSTTIVVNNRLALNHPFAPKELLDIYFEIIGPSEQIIDIQGYVTVGSLTSYSFINLVSNETISETINITKIYSLDKIGKYSIKLVYINESDPGDGRVAWKGKLISDTVLIEIKSDN